MVHAGRAILSPPTCAEGAMLLELTISQLDIGPVSPERADELGRLGYLQWLGALRPDASYLAEARRAYELAVPFARNSPAIAVFCDLLVASTRMPPVPLDVTWPVGARRGGAKARRGAV
jgi:hypothetical protein